MLNIELWQELILISLLLICIAWFMGRAVCTSKEYQVRSQLKMLQNEQNHLSTIISKKDQEIQNITKLSQQFREESEKRFKSILRQKEDDFQKLNEQLQNKIIQLSTIQQEYDIEHNSLSQLKHKHNEILERMQNLKAFEIKFKALSKHYEEKSLEFINLRNNLNDSQIELENIKNLNKKQYYDLKKYKIENKQLNTDYSEQVEKNILLNTRLKDAKKDIMDSMDLIKIQKSDLKHCKDKNDALSKDIQAYKILSTI